MSSPRDSIRALSCLATRFKRVRPIERTLIALKENSICGSKYKIWKQADSSTLTTVQKGKELGFVKKDSLWQFYYPIALRTRWF